MEQRWAALGEAVRRRRAHLGLRQGDLEARDGPSNGTIRNIEQAARTKYADRTLVQLDRALGWWSGVAEKILLDALPAEDLEYAITKPPVPDANFDRYGDPITVRLRHDYDGSQDPAEFDAPAASVSMWEARGWRIVGEPVVGESPESVVGTAWGRVHQFLAWLSRQPQTQARDDALRALSAYLAEVAAGDADVTEQEPAAG